MIIFYLKDILTELGISQTNFSKKAKVRPNTINDMCNNKTRRIEVKTLAQIMLTLNTLSDKKYDISDLLSYTQHNIK